MLHFNTVYYNDMQLLKQRTFFITSQYDDIVVLSSVYVH